MKVYSQTGDYIAPTSTGTADTYMLTLGCGYTYLATKDVYYHAEYAFPAQPGMTLTVPTPRHRGLADGSERQNRQQCTVV